MPGEYFPYDIERLTGAPAMGSDWARRALGRYDPGYGLRPPMAAPAPVATPTPAAALPLPQPTPQLRPQAAPLAQQVPRWIVDLYAQLQQLFAPRELQQPFWEEPYWAMPPGGLKQTMLNLRELGGGYESPYPTPTPTRQPFFDPSSFGWRAW